MKCLVACLKKTHDVGQNLKKTVLESLYKRIIAPTLWFHLSIWNLWHSTLFFCSFRHPLHAQFPCISTAAVCWDNPTMMRTTLNSSAMASLLKSAARSRENLMLQLGEVCNGNQHLVVQSGNSHLIVLFSSFSFLFHTFVPALLFASLSLFWQTSLWMMALIAALGRG